MGFIDILQKQNKPHEQGQIITKQLDEVVVERNRAMQKVFKMRREKKETVQVKRRSVVKTADEDELEI